MSPQNCIVEHHVERHSQAVSARQLKAAEGKVLGSIVRTTMKQSEEEWSDSLKNSSAGTRR